VLFVIVAASDDASRKVNDPRPLRIRFHVVEAAGPTRGRISRRTFRNKFFFGGPTPGPASNS
jgi:hypothetical protein